MRPCLSLPTTQPPVPSVQPSTTRRNLLAQGAAAALLSATFNPVCALAQPGTAASRKPLSDDLLFAGCRYQEQASAPRKTALACVDAKTKALRLIDSPFFPHGWALDIEPQKRAFFFEKRGTGAGVFDLHEQRFVQTINPVHQRQFYGHGVLAQGGQLLLTTEADAQGSGFIGMRDTRTLHYLGDFPSFGARPHDCHLLDGGRVLAVTNGGAAADDNPVPCVSYIDIETRLLLDRHSMPGSSFNTGHMLPLAKNNALVTSAPRLGLGADHAGTVSWCDRGRSTLKIMADPQGIAPQLLGEALSIAALSHEGVAVVTHPTPGLLTFWQLDNQTLRHTVAVANVRGIALASDGRSLWLSHGTQGSLSLLQMDGERDPVVQPVLTRALLGGSHLLNYPVALAAGSASST